MIKEINSYDIYQLADYGTDIDMIEYCLTIAQSQNVKELSHYFKDLPTIKQLNTLFNNAIKKIQC